MVTTIGPYAIFWATALEIAGIGDEFWADALAEEVETGRALTQQVIEQLPRSLDQEECALLILGELMSGVSPYAEPVTLAHATERDALRLRESFRQVLDRMLDDRFIHLQPQGDTPEAPVTDYSDGSMWWSSPSLRGFTPNTLADGDVITRCFRRNYQILGGVPLSSILGDDSIMTVLEQVELWKRQEDRGPLCLSIRPPSRSPSFISTRQRALSTLLIGFRRQLDVTCIRTPGGGDSLGMRNCHRGSSYLSTMQVFPSVSTHTLIRGYPYVQRAVLLAYRGGFPNHSFYFLRSPGGTLPSARSSPKRFNLKRLVHTGQCHRTPHNWSLLKIPGSSMDTTLRDPDNCLE